MSKSEGTQKKSIFGLLAVLIVLVVGLWFGSQWLLNKFVPADGEDELQTVLTNMATIAGIVSGLSLAGFSLLLTTSTGIKALVETYGRLVHWLFLATYFLTVAASLACAFVSGSDNQELMILVGSGAAALLLAGVLLTVLLINSVFGWMQTSEYLDQSNNAL